MYIEIAINQGMIIESRLKEYGQRRQLLVYDRGDNYSFMTEETITRLWTEETITRLWTEETITRL